MQKKPVKAKAGLKTNKPGTRLEFNIFREASRLYLSPKLLNGESAHFAELTKWKKGEKCASLDWLKAFVKMIWITKYGRTNL